MPGSTTNATFSEYIYFDGKRAARRDYQSNVFFYFADQVGSARGMFEVLAGSHTASPCFDADFYPFGGEHDFTNTCPQNYKFMGKERDPETNNDEFGARSYASAYGRFLSADWSSTPSPVPYANLTNPQTLNLYAIVNDNPESFADLDGHDQQSQNSASQAGDCAAKGSGSAAACPTQTTSTQPQGGGQASGNATFTLGGVTVTFKWTTDKDSGGVNITATPDGCDSCRWAQTKSGTGVDGGTQADIQKDTNGQTADAHKYPFAAPGSPNHGELTDSPSRDVSPAKVSYISTMGTPNGKEFVPKGSLVWGFTKDSKGNVNFEGVRQASAAEQKQSLGTWSARTGMTVSSQ